MSSTAISVKRHNHRVYPCDLKRKPELLNFLITSNSELSIIVVTANDPQTLQVTGDNVTLMSDAALAEAPAQQYDLLISYDLPEKALLYMTRLARAKALAVILLEPGEGKRLYPIETMLGRSIMQETISGFEPEVAPEPPKSYAKEPRREYKPREANGRDERKRNDRPERKRDERSERKRDDRPERKYDDKRPPRKPFAADAKDAERADKRSNNDRKPSRYVGKDDNGKPRFSGKTGERNHRYDGTPKEEAAKADSSRSAQKPAPSDEQKNAEKPRAFDPAKATVRKIKKPQQSPKAPASEA